jgi:hypothetical protein
MKIMMRSAQICEEQGSHMPLDLEAHWNWRNPISYVLMFLIALWIVALIGALIGALV